MPAAISHYLQSKDVLDKLILIYPKLKIYTPAFLWGSQGPDFLLSHNRLPFQKGKSINKSGIFIQDKSTHELLKIIDNYFKDHILDIVALSYILGLICHFELDKCAIDFINYSSETLTNVLNKDKKVCRNQIKSSLDIILLRYKRQQLPSEINLKKLIPNDGKTEDFIINFYYDIFSKNHQNDVTREQLYDAICDFRKLFRLMNDRTGLKKKFVKKMEKWQGKSEYASSLIRNLTEEDDFDYANTLHLEWKWPTDSGTIRTDSFFDIYNESIEKSLNVISQLFINDLILLKAQGK